MPNVERAGRPLLSGGDTAFLRERAYPLMRGAAQFCLDWLIEDGQGHLIARKIIFWARFLDGEQAYRMLAKLIAPTTVQTIAAAGSGVLCGARYKLGNAGKMGIVGHAVITL